VCACANVGGSTFVRVSTRGQWHENQRSLEVEIQLLEYLSEEECINRADFSQ